MALPPGWLCVPRLASLRRFGISIRWLTADVGSSTRPSIESHIRKRMFDGFVVATGTARAAADSSARQSSWLQRFIAIALSKLRPAAAAPSSIDFGLGRCNC